MMFALYPKGTIIDATRCSTKWIKDKLKRMSIYMFFYYKNIAFCNEQSEQSHAYLCVTYCKKYFCSWTLRNFSELFVYLDKWNQFKEIWEAKDRQDLGTPTTLGSPGHLDLLGPQEPWEIATTISTSEPKHSELLKLKHK